VRDLIPPRLGRFYPNSVSMAGSKPVVVFRDHRWTLPIIHLAAERGLVRTPARIVTFDRHRDSLVPRITGRFGEYRDDRTLDSILALTSEISPRDDDWLLAGMEAGLLSDAVQFRSERDDLERITRHTDAFGGEHRIFHLGLPGEEIAWKGAFADSGNPAAVAGLWEVMGWDPERCALDPEKGNFVFDIDLDFFTVPWETYMIPFNEEIYRGEFHAPRESRHRSAYPPVAFVRALADAAGVITIACEPDFCGGEEHARRILGDVNHHFFEDALDTAGVVMD
jgi:hypothetical protein